MFKLILLLKSIQKLHAVENHKSITSLVFEIADVQLAKLKGKSTKTE